MKKLNLLFSFNLFLLKRLISFSMPSFVKVGTSLVLLILLGVSSQAQNVGDYRTRVGGNWTVTDNWERYDGSSWIRNPLQGYPGQSVGAGNVTIRNNHNVTLNVSPSNSIGQLLIETGNNATTLTYSAAWILNVIGDVSIQSVSSNVAKGISLGSGRLSCANILLSSVGGNNNNRRAWITISTGTLTVAGDIIMNSTAARTSIACSNSALINVGGSMNGGGFTQSTSTVNYNGTSGIQTVGAYTYNNLSFDGGAVKELSGSISVANELNFNGGILRLGNNNLTMTNANPTGKISGSFSSNSMVETNGNGYLIVSNVNSNRPNIILPIGSEGKYAPFKLVSTGNINNSSVSVRTVSQFNNSNFISRYWDVVSSANRTATMEFSYDATEANGIPENYTTWTGTNGSNWQLSNGTTTLGTNSFTVAGGANNIGTTAKSFTAGAIGTFYSYQSGAWNEPATWTTDPSGTTQMGSSVPSDNDVVVILVDREVFLTSNITAANIDVLINDGGTLNMGSFALSSGLKALRGQGKLKLATASFPNATTNTLVQAGGGTVEYTAPLTLPSGQSYNHLEITAGGMVLQTSNISVLGNLTVNSGTYQINDGTTRRLQLSVDGDVTVKNGASMTTGVGNTTSGGTLTGGTAPFINYYDTNSHRIVVKGNFTNNGTVRFTNQAYPTYNAYPNNGFATVYFMGTTDNLVYCGGQTDFHNLVLDKGSDQTFKLTVQSTAYSNFRLFGRNDQGGDEGELANPNLRKALWIRTGSLVLQGLLVIPSLTEGGGGGTPNSDYYIPANGALILDGPEVVVLSTADDYREVNVAYGVNGGSGSVNGVNKASFASSFSIYGKFQINNGYFSTRESGGFITWDVTSGQVIINGGTVDAKQFRAAGGATGKASYEQSGGILLLRGRFQRLPTQYSTINDLKVFSDVTLSTTRLTSGLDGSKGTFNINAAANVFSMSGGAIRIYDVCGGNPYALDVFAAANNINVTGGTLEIDMRTGNSSADDRDYTIRSNAPFGNLRVLRGSGTSSVLLDNAYPLTLVKNLEVVSGVLNTQNTNVTVGGNIRFYNGATYTAGSGTLTLNGADDQQFRIDLASALTLNHLRIEKGRYFFVEFAGSQKSVNINGNLTIENADFKDNGNILYVAGNIYNTGYHTGTGRLHLNGSSVQTLGGTGEFGNITLQNTNGAAAPVSLSSNLTVNGLLTFANDKILDIANFNLRMSQTASFSGISSNRYITSNGAAGDGGVTRVFNSNIPFVFPVGSGGYTPATINITGVPNSYGSITVVPVAYAHPNVTAPNRSLNYFWRVKSEGFDLGTATVTHQYNYMQSSVVSGGDVTEGGYVAARFNPSDNSWSSGDVDDVDENSNIIGGAFLTNMVDIDGDYTAGDSAPINPFGTPVVYYSRRSGFWDQTSTWSLTGHTVDDVPATVPGASDIVVIGANHKVDLRTHNTNINTGVRSCASLQIEAGATLDVGFNPGSNFRLVRSHPNGNGLIRITTSYTDGSTFSFPSGDFSDFNNNLGSTELYSTNPTSGTKYWLPNGVREYGNLTISPVGGSNIIFPNNDVVILGNCTIKGQNADSWFCPTWNGNYPTAPTARVSKTITIKGNMDIQGGSFGWYGNNGGGAQNVVVEGDVIVAPGAGIDVWSPNTSQSLSIGGSLVNNSTNSIASGTSTRSYVNLSQVAVTFFGARNAQITNSAGNPRTDFNVVVVNKGNSKDTRLTCNIGGVLNTPTNNWLTIQNGTFEYVRTGNLSITTTSAFTIPSTGGLLVDAPSSEVLIGNASNNNSDLFLNGKLTVLNGDVYIGPKTFPNNNNDIEYSAGGAAEIELTGGRLIVNGQIRRNPATTQGVLKYAQSGDSRVIIMGNAALATNAKLEIANSGSSFSMSDNSQLIIARGGGTTYGDLYIRPETSSVTGGEIVFSQVTGISTVDAVQNYTLDANVPLNDLTISGKTTATARNATVKLLVSPLVLKGNLTLSNNRSIFDANVGFNINVTIGGDLDNNGTYNHYNNTTTFSGGVQSIKGNTETDFFDLVVNPVTSLTIIRNVNVSRNATIASGTLILGVNNMFVGGNLVNNSTYTTSSGSISLNGINAQQEVSGTGTYGRLELNNPKGARILNDVTLQGSLRLLQGIFNINQYLLTLGVNAWVEGTPDATRMIVTDGVYSNQGVKKVFNPGVTTTLTLPIGASGKYTPARLQITANAGGTGYWRVNPVNNQHPSALSPYRVLNYYWDVETSGLTGITGNMQLTYLDSDVQQDGGDEAAYVAARLLTPGTSWSKANPGAGSDNVNESTNIISFTYSGSDNLSGEYTAGIDVDIPDDIPVYRTVKDGVWNDPDVWTQVGVFNPALPAIPNGFIVQIDHDVEVNVANVFAYRTTINNRLKFVSGYTGHNIGNVDGSGTLYVESAVFPAGRFTEFLDCSNNAILEYGGIGKDYTINANLYSSASVVKITGTGVRTMPNKSLTFCNQLIFDGPTINMTVGNPVYTILGTIERYNSSSVNATSGIVSFAGNAPQFVGGATGDFYGSNALNRIRLNNPNGVTLLSPTEVQGGLELTNGLLHSSPTNPLLISATSNMAVSPSAGRSNSYVNGPMIKRIVSGDSFQFPIGKDNVWTNKLSLSNSLPGTIDWTAEFFTPNSTYTEKMGELSAVDALGYYRISAANGSTAVVNLTWDANSDVTPLVTSNGLADMRVARFNDSELKWEEVESNAVGGNNAGTVSTVVNETITAGGFANYAIGSVNSIKPKIQFNTANSICGLTSGLPLSIVSVGAVPFNYSVVYSINNVNQPPVTITSMPYTIPTPVAGIYKLVSFTYNNGTRSGVVDNKVVSVYEIPTTALAGSDQSLCGASSAIMSANEPVVGTGQWSVVSGTGGSFVNPTHYDSEFNGTNGTNYLLRWTISNGTCTSADDVAVSFPLLPVRPGDFTEGDPEVCQGATGVRYTVPVIPAATYHWSYSGTGVTINGSQNSVELNFALNATSGTLSVYTSNGCGNSASRSYSVTVNETVLVTLASDDADNAVCHNQTITLTASKSVATPVDYEFFVDNISKQRTSSDTYSMVGLLNSYVIRVDAITALGCRSASNEIVINGIKTPGIWTGNGDSDWFNTANWCDGTLPQEVDNVVIDASTNAPVVSGSALVQINNLTVANSALTIEPGTKMTVHGNINVSATGDLIVEHDLGNRLASFINKGSSSGGVTVKVHYPLLARNWYVGHPVKTTSDAYFNAGGFSLWSYAHSTATELWLTESVGRSYLSSAQGFIANNGSGVAKTVVHKGDLYHGNQSFTVIPDAKNQWNLVANPFNGYLNPKVLDFSNIDKTIWYRTYKDATYQFVTYNQEEDIVLPFDQSILIAPMQAFWVRAVNSGSLVFDVNALRHPDSDNPMLKSGRMSMQDVLYLQLSNDKTNDQTAIAFRLSGHIGYGQNDSEKRLSGGSMPNLYSVKGGKTTSINIQPEEPDANGIQLGYSLGKGANNGLKLQVLNIHNFMPAMGVYLEDRTTGARIDLRANPEYAFTSDPKTDNSRFVLKFEKISTGVDDDLVAEQKGERIRIYGQRGKAIVLVGSELLRQGDARVNIFNLAGNLMSTHRVVETRAELTLPDAPAIYLVEVEAGGQVKREKVVK